MTQFEQFYAATWPSLLRSLVVITTNRADAEDVLQEAYAKAARNWDVVERLDNPAGWVRRVAVNAAVDVHRRGRRRREAQLRVARPDEQVDDLSVEVMDALRSLPVEERQVVVLHHLLALRVDDIAAELGRPSGTVKAQLVRGRKRLAERLRIDLEVGKA